MPTLAADLDTCGDDYERLLVGAPNSSFMWVRYMSFLLEVTEIDKARDDLRVQ